VQLPEDVQTFFVSRAVEATVSVPVFVGSGAEAVTVIAASIVSGGAPPPPGA
jgi:hypothetical protein